MTNQTNWKLRLGSVEWVDGYEYYDYDGKDYNFDQEIQHIELNFTFRLIMNENENIEDISIKSLKDYFYGLQDCLLSESNCKIGDIEIFKNLIRHEIYTVFDISSGIREENEERIIHMVNGLRRYMDLTVFLDELDEGFNDKEQFTDTSDKEIFLKYAPYREFYKYLRETILGSLTNEERLLVETSNL